MKPDEICTCRHGGEDAEDHTPGNGCEHPGCTCRFWLVEDEETVVSAKFINTGTWNRITKFYTVEDAPLLRVGGSSRMVIQPTAVRLSFHNGSFVEIAVTGELQKKDGTFSNRVIRAHDIYPFNKSEWPDWLTDLFEIARVETQKGSDD